MFTWLLKRTQGYNSMLTSLYICFFKLLFDFRNHGHAARIALDKAIEAEELLGVMKGVYANKDNNFSAVKLFIVVVVPVSAITQINFRKQQRRTGSNMLQDRFSPSVGCFFDRYRRVW
ncbi:hypothetical protein CDAR_534141 [Caerostris darwini]|uniref:Uncharacterized protein n=1 Tax=Caerostris darwini TaxID=1538125 RepID=A0AAV4S4Q5_9ARAC|nr:hypothetical protein CDAR_534141 [Caerostris darwini]